MSFQTIENEIIYMNSLPLISYSGQIKQQQKIDKLKYPYNIAKLHYLMQKYVPPYLPVRVGNAHGIYNSQFSNCTIAIYDISHPQNIHNIDHNEFFEPDYIGIYFDNLDELKQNFKTIFDNFEAEKKKVEIQRLKEIDNIEQKLFDELDELDIRTIKYDTQQQKRKKAQKQINHAFDKKIKEIEEKCAKTINQEQAITNRNDLINILNILKIDFGESFMIIQLQSIIFKKYMIIFENEKLFNELFKKEKKVDEKIFNFRESTFIKAA